MKSEMVTFIGLFLMFVGVTLMILAFLWHLWLTLP